MGLEFLVPIFGILIVLVPITGLTVVFTSKYATKSVVEVLAQLRRGESASATTAELEARVHDLTEQVEVLSEEVRRLRAAQDFDHQLIAPAQSTATGSPPSRS
ncbi:MAG: hypothetical protein LJF06_01130 [Gemmatimonadetes bacterium]|nr:hypothetical protein [Gemmatimonadota bacterium]